MNLAELHGAADRALSAEPDRRALQNAASMALHLADMVSWAPARIDLDGGVRAGLDGLRARARIVFECHGSVEIGALHDAIAELTDAIARHDRDLEPCRAGAVGMVDMV